MISKGRSAKLAFHCKNGPFEGQTLWLSSPSTLTLTVKKVSGSYVTNGGYSLKWVPNGKS